MQRWCARCLRSCARCRLPERTMLRLLQGVQSLTVRLAIFEFISSAGSPGRARCRPTNLPRWSVHA